MISHKASCYFFPLIEQYVKTEKMSIYYYIYIKASLIGPPGIVNVMLDRNARNKIIV